MRRSIIGKLENVGSVGIHDKDLPESGAVRVKGDFVAARRPSGQSIIGSRKVSYVPGFACVRVDREDPPARGKAVERS